MNLLTLQICKEDAEKMINDPGSFLKDYSYFGPGIGAIKEQGKRTLEVIAEVERGIKRRQRVNRNGYIG